MKKTVREKYFNGECLTAIPKKEKSKLEVLDEIIKLFEKKRIYDEKEINEVLKNIYPDFAILRRYMVDYKYLNRNKECTKYSVNER